MPSLQLYNPHAGTIRISGSTDCAQAAACALKRLQSDLKPELVFIGANAGQQATKTVGALTEHMTVLSEGRVRIVAEAARALIPSSKGDGTVQCQIWRLSAVDGSIFTSLKL